MTEADNPRKRQRTLSPEHRPVYTRHEDLWFEDGNIILISQDKIGLRVHKTILSKHSKVFRDMLILSDPPTSHNEWAEECPFLELEDSGADLAYLLDPLYSGGAGDHFGAGFPAPIEMVAAMAKLGTKYQVPHLREEAIRRIERLFPSDQPPLWPMYRTACHIGKFDGLPIAVLDLVRDLDLRRLLPSVLYACAFLPPSIQVNGARRPNGTLYKLSPEDLTICLTGKDLIKDAVVRAAAKALKFPLCENCSKLDLDYLDVLSRMLISRKAIGRKAMDAKGMDPISALTFISLGDIDACDICRDSFSFRVVEQQEAVWVNIGKYFGLNT